MCISFYAFSQVMTLCIVLWEGFVGVTLALPLFMLCSRFENLYILLLYIYYIVVSLERCAKWSNQRQQLEPNVSGSDFKCGHCTFCCKAGRERGKLEQ